MSMRRVITVIVQTLIMYLTFFPLFFLVGHFWLREQLAPMLLLFAGGSIVGFALSFFRLKIYIEYLIAALCAIGGVYAAFGMTPAYPAAAALLALIVNRSAWTARGAWNSAFPVGFQLLGVGTYILFPIFAQIDPGTRDDAGYVFVLGFAAVAALYYRLNQYQLSKANLTKHAGGVPAIVKWRNRLMLAGFLVLIFLISQMNALRAWFSGLRDRFIDWMNGLLQREEQAPPPVEPPRQDPALDMIGGMEQEEPMSPFWQAVQDFVIHAVAIIFLLVIAALLVYLIVSKWLPMLRHYISGLNKDRDAAGDYVDETEKLEIPNWGQTFFKAVGRLRGRQNEAPENDREYVRWRYKKMLQTAVKDGYAHEASRTPLESETELERIKWSKQPVSQLTRLYNQARYGEKAISAEQRQELEQLKRL